MPSPQTSKESRIGKNPVPIPANVQVSLEGAIVTVKGPRGELTRTLHPNITVTREDDKLVVAVAPGSSGGGTHFQGLTRSLLFNAVHGVSEGFKRSLDLHGVGYRAEVAGQLVTLALGLSHPVKFQLPEGVSGRVEVIDQGGVKRPRLHLESHDKELLGETAARLRAFRPPEPYKGKGVRYTGEYVREKAGKTGAK